MAKPTHHPARARRLLRPLLAIALGALAGYAYYALIGCHSGSCGISSDPFYSSLYGSVIGLVLVGWSSAPGPGTRESKRKQENDMPLYDYHCEHCDKRFEVLRRRDDERTVTCPDCGETALRQLSGVAVGGSSSRVVSSPSGAGNASCGSWTGG